MLVAVHVCLFLSFPAGDQVMPRRRDVSKSCCLPLHLNEDNARFGLLAALILLYLLCGAVVFSALEHPSELQTHRRWDEQLANFTEQNSINLKSLHVLLKQYEEAFAAGIRVDKLRPRWDFSGAFYFVATVISTIGEFIQRHLCIQIFKTENKFAKKRIYRNHSFHRSFYLK